MFLYHDIRNRATGIIPTVNEVASALNDYRYHKLPNNATNWKRLLEHVRTLLIENSGSWTTLGLGENDFGSKSLPRKWKSAFFASSKVMVYLSSLDHKNSLGNRFGAYVNQLACAASSGASVIVIDSDSLDSKSTSSYISLRVAVAAAAGTTGTASNRPPAPRRRRGGVEYTLPENSFLEAFPSVFIPPDPFLPLEEVQLRVSKHCVCHRYCWEDPRAPWIPHIPLIKKLLLDAADRYLAAAAVVSETKAQYTVYDSVTDVLRIPSHTTNDDEEASTEEATTETSATVKKAVTATRSMGNTVVHRVSTKAIRFIINDEDTSQDSTAAELLDKESTIPKLPLIPDVTVHYRCSDNIGWRDKYGLIPFWALVNLIPKDSGTIYILSEVHTRSTEAMREGAKEKCDYILHKLVDYLHRHFPSAIVLLKRDDSVYLDMTRMMLSRVTICSASTFCFWSAMASRGTAYFPVTNLIAKAKDILLAEETENGYDNVDTDTNAADNDKDDVIPIHGGMYTRYTKKFSGNNATGVTPLDFGPNFHWILHPQIIHAIPDTDAELLALLTDPSYHFTAPNNYEYTEEYVARNNDNAHRDHNRFYYRYLYTITTSATSYLFVTLLTPRLVHTTLFKIPLLAFLLVFFILLVMIVIVKRIILLHHHPRRNIRDKHNRGE